MRKFLSVLIACIAVFAAHAEQWAQVGIPVTCLRATPAHSSEQVSQAILATPLKITEKKGDWYKVNTPDGYTGWVRSNTVKLRSEADMARWRQTPRAVCKNWTSRLYNEAYEPDGYCTYGVFLSTSDEPEVEPGWLEVTPPDGNSHFARASDFYRSTEDWEQACSRSGASEVIAVAMSMLGAPYLWGGASSLAPDCSGFTQTAYMAAGMLLPRDTSMQIKCGEAVDGISDAKPGDLVFYGDNGQVNHVAIYLGDKRIIHSSGHVRICRMNERASGNEELYTDKPMSIRRVLGVSGTKADEAAPGVPSLVRSNWYF